MSYNKQFINRNEFKNSKEYISKLLNKIPNKQLDNIDNVKTVQNVTIPDFNKVPLKIFQTWHTINLPKNICCFATFF